MTPTPAQLRYLKNAVAVVDAGTGIRNHFDIDGPGPHQTGVSCADNEWIELYDHVGCASGFIVTPAGRAIVEASG